MLAGLFVIVAALCATADGALLTIDENEPASDVAVRHLLANREATTVRWPSAAFWRNWAPAPALAAGAQRGVTRARGHRGGAVRHHRVGEWCPRPRRRPRRPGVAAFGTGRPDRGGRPAPGRGIRLVVRRGARAPVAAPRPTTKRVRPTSSASARSLPPRWPTVTVARPDSNCCPASSPLGDTRVSEIMVPRVDIVGIERGTRWADMVARVRSARHARLVVYGDDLDDVSGILFAKDLLGAVLDDAEPVAGWQSLVRPAWFIPGTNTVDAQLRDFRTNRRHIALVVDEFGGVAGLVTLEDVIELIVGDIRDEHDTEDDDQIEREGG